MKEKFTYNGANAEGIDGETVAAIAMALSLHTGSSVHDRESYVITIRRKRRSGDVVYLA